MLSLPASLQKLIRELTKLPSIGEKSATRLAYHLVGGDRELAQSLSASLSEVVEQIKYCKRCFYFADEDNCRICNKTDRDDGLLCVVEKPADVMAIERMGEYRGLYHVLHGVWAPLRGKGPEQLKLKELLERVEKEKIKEIIMALSPTVEGDATSLYLAELLSNRGIILSRLAQGLPKGGELEYADDLTITRAFFGRNIFPAS